MKVGDLVKLKKEYEIAGIFYGAGVVMEVTRYPEDGMTYYKVTWAHGDFSFHVESDLELISESR